MNGFSQRLSPRHRAVVGAAFVLAFAFRYLTLGGLGGDDHWSLWNAATFLKGDQPFRDFADLGDPLYWAVSALAQVLVGYRVIGEVLLGSALVAFAMAASFHMAWQASRSLLVAILLTVIVVVLMSVTKLYSYPKIFVYPLGLWLSWRYIDRPTLLRAVLLALGVAVAFGYRHDHGAYVGVGAAAAVLAAHWKDGVRGMWMPLCRIGAAGLVILAPYFILIQINEGLIAYFTERISMAARLDAAGRRMVPFVVDSTVPQSWIGISPPAPARVAVTWADVRVDTQLELEKRYSLTGRVEVKGGWHRYVLDDSSDANLAALMANPRVGLVDGITGSFRRGYGVLEPKPYGATIKVQWLGSLSDQRRTELERRYHLTNGRTNPSDAGGHSQVYDITDVSPDNLNALARERYMPAIEGLQPLIVPMVVGLREPVPAGPRVAVYWKPDVTDAERVELERRYQLVNRRRDPDDAPQLWRYELADVSEANATAIKTSLRTRDTGGLIDGSTPGTYKASDTWPVLGKLSVRWAVDVADAEQAELERRYHLRSQSADVGATEYTLVDAGRENIHALVSDPRVRDVSGIDREHDRPAGESWWGSLSRRTPLLRLRVFPKFLHAANAGVWIYYLSFALPFFVLATLAIDRIRGVVLPGMPHVAQKLMVSAVMMGVANLALLRKLGYFADHADVEAVLGAWLIGHILHTRSAMRAKTWAVRVLVSATLLITIVAAATYVDLSAVPARMGFGSGWADFREVNGRQLAGYTTSPPIDEYAPVDALGDRALLRYIYACTRPDDRVWVTSDVYTIPYYTERRVVGHIFWGMGFLASPEQQRRTIAMLEKDPVPLILGVGGSRPLQYLEAYDLVHEYASKRYVEYYPILQDRLDREGTIIWLAVDSRRTPTSTYARLGLPCFK